MKVVLNCVGPYRFLGERVVRACVDSGASRIASSKYMNADLGALGLSVDGTGASP